MVYVSCLDGGSDLFDSRSLRCNSTGECAVQDYLYSSVDQTA